MTDTAATSDPAGSNAAMSGDAAKPRQIKLVVWDLDNTLWDGTLLEGDAVAPRPEVVEVIRTLDARGILHSIASKNDPTAALEKLEALGLSGLFLYPQIGWSAKSVGIRKAVETINIGFDAVAFVDDQPFEREEVAHALPEVWTVDAAEAGTLADRSELMPRFITDESALRRSMYQADAARNSAQDDFEGPEETFLAGLDMHFTIAPAAEEDLQRAEELTVRTNQLNATGVTYSYEELDAFRRSPDHLLLVASLVDKYGTYGKIGLALIEMGADTWMLKMLLMSCRVMSRGVGTILLSRILRLAKESGARLRAEFKSTDRNRMMKITYRFAGFEEVERNGEVAILEHDLERIQPFPDYVVVDTPGVPVA